MIKFIASSILPFSIDSRIFKRSSTNFKSILSNDKPASQAKISAASLNPSKNYFYFLRYENQISLPVIK